MRAKTVVSDQLRQLGPRLPAALSGNPPRLYELEDYKRWFPRTGKSFLRYLKRSGVLESITPPTGAPTLGIMVAPWVSTPTPWYAVMLAAGLARRGRSVVIFWDDTGFVEDHLAAQSEVIADVLEYVGQTFPVVRLRSATAVASQEGDAGLIDSATAQNLTWRLRGGVQTEDDAPLTEQVRSSLAASLPYVRGALDGFDLDCLVVPGGVYGTSGLFRHVAMAKSWRVATFDADRSIGQLCVDGVAAQNGDIARAFESLLALGEPTISNAVAVARAEFQLRTESTDDYGFQTVPAGGDDATGAGGVLMPLNVEWDTAALGKHIHFADTPEWLAVTIAAILESDDGPVIVRQHPSERRKLQRSKLDIGSLLSERFGNDPRVQFIAAEDPVSSYDLLRSARLVLPYVSTIAIEAAAMGKPVLVSGAAYYAGLGFVRSAGSREDYLAMVRRGLTGDLELLPDQVDRAWLCYYLTAVRNRIPTDFTPHPADFWSWSSKSPDVLFADPEVADMLAAIDTNVPISLMRHRRIAATATGGE